MNSKTNRILIIGSGLAGSTLALELAEHNIHITLIDNQFHQSSSRIAAGLLNPIVPKGVRKTWQCDTLFPAVFTYYAKWEQTLNQRFIHQIPFLNLHANPNEAHEWDLQLKNPSMEGWLTKADTEDIQYLPFQSATWVNHCGRLDVAKFLQAVQHHFESCGQFVSAEFQHQNLQKLAGGWRYQQHDYDAVVFCEGIGVSVNPWFDSLFFDPTGGDILTVHIPNLGTEPKIIKQKQWIVPTAEKDIYLVGGNFHKGNLSHIPEKQDAEYLLERVKSITQQPVTLIEHRRAVRPTVQQRRPYLGEHALEKGLFIFNGLGAKGSSLCCWLAPMLCKRILNQGNLHPEVDIARFSG